MKVFSWLGGLTLLAGLVACSGKPQEQGSRVAPANPAYMGAVQGGAYVAPGWQAGDKASWEEKIRSRTQAGQNEYQRTAGRS